MLMEGHCSAKIVEQHCRGSLNPTFEFMVFNDENQTDATRDIVWQFEWWDAVLDVDVEYVIVFLPLV